MQLPPHFERIVEQVCQGKPNKIIAFELGISVSTVKTYLYQIFRLEGVRSRAELIVSRLTKAQL